MSTGDHPMYCPCPKGNRDQCIYHDHGKCEYVKPETEIAEETDRYEAQIAAQSAEIERLHEHIYAAFGILEDTQKHSDTEDDPGVGARIRYWMHGTKKEMRAL